MQSMTLSLDQNNQYNVVLCVQYEAKKGGKDHESKQSSTTPDTGYQMGQ